MDPEANLEEQLRLARQIEEIYDGSEEISQSEAYDLADMAMDLAELVLAKAEWDRKVHRGAVQGSPNPRQAKEKHDV